MPRTVVMDGEIVCLDERGHCQFNDLLFRRAEPCFVAFDLLHANGKDLRREQLVDRKLELRRVIGGGDADRLRGPHRGYRNGTI
jgi:ATP-dependent DNA ligase